MIATLLKDKTGSSCEIPIDCRAQLNTYTYDNPEDEGLYDTDDDDNGYSSRGVPYEGYPQLSQRFHLLVGYMEKQKPKGFRALWRDNRDSNSWFTFWAAVIFGSSLQSLYGIINSEYEYQEALNVSISICKFYCKR